jgi:ABC-type amino acid transport system permease subunit
MPAENEKRRQEGGKMKLIVAAASLLCSLPVFAGVNSAIFFQVPTLDEFGLIGLVVAVGVAAGLIIRRKKK